MRIAKAASLYFTLVFGAGFVLGSIRVPFIVPRLGERYAELLEMPLMFVAILLAARYIARRFQLPTSWAVCLTVGLTALGLLVAAELLLGAVLQGRSLGQYLASRDPVSGSVYLVMLLVFAFMPAIVARRGATAVSSAHGQA